MDGNQIEFEFWDYFKGLTRQEQYSIYLAMQDIIYAADVKATKD
ncbi:hypothetical protein [Nicoliella lavandulae]|uniref:Uncharacterized protein n=1 Tax=Nicoliella lavandulae TaxID=3082954 RepID=A0ABU8SM90_9LACO